MIFRFYIHVQQPTANCGTILLLLNTASTMISSLNLNLDGLLNSNTTCSTTSNSDLEDDWIDTTFENHTDITSKHRPNWRFTRPTMLQESYVLI